MNGGNLRDGIPLGFGMALAENSDAMEVFSRLSDDQKNVIINGTQNIHSKQEMREYVSRLTGSLQG